MGILICHAPMRFRTSIVSGAVILSLLAVGGMLAYAKRESEFVATISYAHHISVGLQVYVRDHGHFPQDLDDMARDVMSDPRALRPPFGSSVQYERPPDLAPDSTRILTVTHRGREIVVTKDFTRRP